jgi:error-prone DNA polymerase
VQPDGTVRLGLMYVNGLRAETGRTIAARVPSVTRYTLPVTRCTKCGNDDVSMIEETPQKTRFCNICAHEWIPSKSADPVEQQVPYASIEDLIARTRLRRDEIATLAEIGALNSLGYDRRSAQWQIERASRRAGELLEERTANREERTAGNGQRVTGNGQRPSASEGGSPLRPMSPSERLMADYSGSSLTIGPHPLALRRQELALRGVQRASDLPRGRHGRRVRVAGAVITRQRPGTAKGFVFLTLEDETGIANIIVRPDLFSEQRQTIVGAPYLMVEGVLQIQEGVTSVKAERVTSLTGSGPEPQSHDFH